MSKISAAVVKELRDRTGLGMMDCKKALVAADGDIEQAIEDLRKSSGMKAAKKAGRVAAEGVVATKMSDDGSFGIMVEVNSETDFAARDENFLGFVGAVADQVFDSKETDVEKLLEAGLEGTREALVQKIGENIGVRRAECKTAADGVVGNYVHGNSRIAVLVELKGGDVQLAKDVAMHVAAINPAVVSPDQVDEQQIAKEREIFSAQAAESGKPPEIVEKMVEGRIRKYLAEVSLTEQPFVKDPDVKVGKLLKDSGASVVSFVRYEVGEGIEKEEVDFAAEVAAQAGTAS
ncbi:MAG: translation elongation factor Ts [Pseudomonadales bacterium]|nr:translation elongation factor Ts [Pseudomonadales bacterium]